MEAGAVGKQQRLPGPAVGAPGALPWLLVLSPHPHCDQPRLRRVSSVHPCVCFSQTRGSLKTVLSVPRAFLDAAPCKNTQWLTSMGVGVCVCVTIFLLLLFNLSSSRPCQLLEGGQPVQAARGASFSEAHVF